MITVSPRRITGRAVTAGAVAAAAIGLLAPSASAAAHRSVPWRQAGPGWTVALTTTDANAKVLRETLSLVSSHGDSYPAASLTGIDHVAAWSPDRRHVLVATDTDYFSVDLANGHSHRLVGLHLSDVFAYTQPDGASILAESPQGLQLFSSSGVLRHGYPKSVPGAGHLSGTPDLGDVEGIFQNPSGTRLVLGAQHGLVELTTAGTVVRRLMGSTENCTPTGTAWAGGALATCGGAMWAVPLSGAKATRLTPAKSTNSPFGNLDIWAYSHGRLGIAESSCGPNRLVRFTSAGRSTPLTLTMPSQVGGTPSYVGHRGDTIEATAPVAGTCQRERVSLFVSDVVHHTSKLLLAAPGRKGTVLSVEPFHTDR